MAHREKEDRAGAPAAKEKAHLATRGERRGPGCSLAQNKVDDFQVVTRLRAGGGRRATRARKRRRERHKCTPRLGTGPRYNVQRTERPWRYPTPPELVLLYNAKRGTPVFGGAKIVPDERTSHQKGGPTGTRETPAEHPRNTRGTPAEHPRKVLPGDPAGWGFSPRPAPPPSSSQRPTRTRVGVNFYFELGCSTDGLSR